MRKFCHQAPSRQAAHQSEKVDPHSGPAEIFPSWLQLWVALLGPFKGTLLPWMLRALAFAAAGEGHVFFQAERQSPLPSLSCFGSWAKALLSIGGVEAQSNYIICPKIQTKSYDKSLLIYVRGGMLVSSFDVWDCRGP